MDIKTIHLQRGENIANIRKRNGYTQDQLAERLGISKSYLAHVEQGDTQFSMDTLCKFLTILNASADEVFFGKSRETQIREIISILDDNEDAVVDLDLICKILHSIADYGRGTN